MTDPATNDASQNERLAEILAAYLESERSGQRINRQRLLAEFAELADELRAFFVEHDRMNAVAESLRFVDTPQAESAISEATFISHGEQPLGADEASIPAADARGLAAQLGKSASSRPGSIVRYFGDYELLSEISRGGMGVVYKARQVKLNRLVAIKMILAGQLASQEDVGRFYVEAEAAAKLSHTNIVPIFEVGQHEHQHYFSMGFVDGKSLAHRIAQGVLAPTEAAWLLKDVASAIAYAHGEGVIHRDLKPGNILIDKDGTPRVTDFGLAKRVEGEASGLTATGQILGTPSYMPPEQARGESAEVSQLSDVYSLGAVLYCLVTGRPPFQASNAVDTLLQVMSREPVSPRQLNPAVPLDLETIILKCLEKQPSRRYASGQHLVDELTQFLEGRPILARPVSAAERGWRWCRRHPATAALTAGMVASLLIGTVISWSYAVQADKQAKQALLNAKLAEQKQIEAEIARDETKQANTQLAHANTNLEKANASERAAKQEAEEKRSEAEKARDETSRVLDYLVAAFRKSDPSQDGEQLTVAGLFGQAAEQLDQTFPDQPLIHAQLLNAIGLTYSGLGLFPKAIIVLERARDLRRRELGEDHEHTLTVMNNLAEAYRSAGHIAVALPLHQQTLALRKAKLGPEHADTLTSMNNLAGAFESEGRLKESLPLFERALELRKSVLGPEHADTLTSMANLANAYASSDQLERASTLYEETLALMKITFGPDQPDTLLVMNNLALAYRSAGRLKEALTLFEKTLELMKPKLGPDHPDTLLAMNNLAITYESAKRLPEALLLYEQTLELRKGKLGLDHPNTLASMNNLAYGYASAGRLSEALPLYEQTVELMIAKLSPDHPNTLAAMGNLAAAYLMAEQPEKALALNDSIIATQRKRLGPDDPGFAGLLAAVSLKLLNHQQYSTAETYLRECLTIREQNWPDEWVVFNTKSLLGGVLAGQEKFEEAEPLLVDGYSGMKDREANIPPVARIRLNEAIQRLVDFYTDWNKPDEAAKWKLILDVSIKNGKE